MKKISLMLVLTAWAVCSMRAQSAIHFVYLDASEPLVNEDFFSDGEIRKLFEVVDASRDVEVFYCDGNTSRLFRGNNVHAELSDILYSQVPKQSEWRYDRNKVRDYLFSSLEDFSGEVNLSFFLSDKQVKDIIAGTNFVPKMLPREMFAVGKSSIKKMKVHLYYSNDRGKIEKDRLKDVLEFYNAEFQPTIEFELTEIK
jgi:hypothetical protein